MNDNEKTLEDFANTPVTAVLLHKESGKWTAKDTRRRHVRAFAEAGVESFLRGTPDYSKTEYTAVLEARRLEAEPLFSVIEIDWANRHLEITTLSDKK